MDILKLFQRDDFAHPGELDDKTKKELREKLAACPAGTLMEELFSNIIRRTNPICGSVVEFFEGALARLEAGGFDEAIKQCDCPHCRFKRDFIRDAMPPLMAAVSALKALHLKWSPVVQKMADEEQAKASKKRSAQDIIARGKPEKFS